MEEGGCIRNAVKHVPTEIGTIKILRFFRFLGVQQPYEQ